MYTKKNISERDKDIQTRKGNQKKFYVPVISSKCCRSSSCSWKFPLENNIVSKNHSHWKYPGANFTPGESDNTDVDVVKEYKNVWLLLKIYLVWIAPDKYFFLHAWLSKFVLIVLGEIEGQL